MLLFCCFDAVCATICVRVNVFNVACFEHVCCRAKKKLAVVLIVFVGSNPHHVSCVCVEGF